MCVWGCTYDVCVWGAHVRVWGTHMMCVVGTHMMCVNTTPQMTRFRGAKVCRKWQQERNDDHNIQSDYKNKSGLQSENSVNGIVSAL